MDFGPWFLLIFFKAEFSIEIAIKNFFKLNFLLKSPLKKEMYFRSTKVTKIEICNEIFETRKTHLLE